MDSLAISKQFEQILVAKNNNKMTGTNHKVCLSYS